MADNAFSLLIAEDDLAARNILEKMISIKFRGCTIYSADNGRQGLRLFKEHHPNIVITDIKMPEMDGIEMAHEIRGIDGGIPLIVLTAYNDATFLQRLAEIKVCNYLMKPVNFSDLFTSIERCAVL
jgi:YesN/AraC family two-component response regulator